MFKAVIPYSKEHCEITARNREQIIARMPKEDRDRFMHRIQYLGLTRSGMAEGYLINMIGAYMGYDMLYSTKYKLVWEQEPTPAWEELGLHMLGQGTINYTVRRYDTQLISAIGDREFRSCPIRLWPMSVDNNIIHVGDSVVARTMMTIWRLLDQRTRAEDGFGRIPLIINDADYITKVEDLPNTLPSPDKLALPRLFMNVRRGPASDLIVYRGHPR